MIRKLPLMILAAALILALLPVCALAEDTTPTDGYNDYDFNKLQAFLETENGGVKNGLRLNASYDKDIPTTWHGVIWSSDAEKRLVDINWQSTPIGGGLDLSGCTALESVYCWATDISSVDVSGCTALTSLRCDNNNISAFDIAGCSALIVLYLSQNDIRSLDVSGFPTLQFIHCSENENLAAFNASGLPLLNEVYCDGCAITSLDISGSSMEELLCDHNPLPELDLSGCSITQELDCSNTLLESLDVSGFEMTGLNCSECALTSLTLSGCNALERLNCDDNALTELDLTDCTSLKNLICSNNALVSLDVSGNNDLGVVFCNDNAISTLSLGPSTAGLLCSGNELAALDLSAYDMIALDCTDNPLRSVDAVCNGDSVSLAANGSGYVGIYCYPSDDYYATATPEAGSPFVNWTNTADGTQVSANLQYGLTEGADYDLTANFLGLSSSVASGTIYTDGRITLTPNIEGGEWDWDEEYLSATFNSPATFTGLKAGTTTVTYTVGGVSASYDVMIEESELPSTGQDFTQAWMLCGVALILGAAGAFVRRNRTVRGK